MLAARLKPSRRLAILLAMAHLAGIALMWPLTLPLWWKILLAPMLAASLLFHLQRDAYLLTPHAVVGIEIGEDGLSLLKTKNGAEMPAQLLGGSFVAPYLTVLAFRSPKHRFAKYVTILPDSIAADEFRRLRVWLKWKVNFAAANSVEMNKPG